MVEVLPEIVTIVFLVFCLIDCIQSDPDRVRNLPKWGWLVLIVLLPLVGGVAWLIAGRPPVGASSAAVPWRSTETAGYPEYERPSNPQANSEIDDRLRADVDRVDREFEEALRKDRDRVRENQESLRQWEDDLRERERRLADRHPDDAPD